MQAFSVMFYRQVLRFFRARARVVAMIVNPLIWLLFFGLGWSRVFQSPMARMIFGGVDYLTFLAPGIFAMTLFSQSFIGGVSVIWDKQFGFLKEILVAPAPRSASIAGRIVGDATLVTLQGLVVLLLTFPLAHALRPAGLLPSLFLGFLMALAFAGLGTALALKMESLEGFQMFMMILILPLTFLSGAIYPIAAMPGWMQALAYANPLTYAVDGARHYLVGEAAARFSLALDWGLLLLLGLGFLLLAVLAFRRATLEG